MRTYFGLLLWINICITHLKNKKEIDIIYRLNKNTEVNDLRRKAKYSNSFDDQTTQMIFIKKEFFFVLDKILSMSSYCTKNIGAIRFIIIILTHINFFNFNILRY